MDRANPQGQRPTVFQEGKGRREESRNRGFLEKVGSRAELWSTRGTWPRAKENGLS